MITENASGKLQSLQVSKMGSVPAGESYFPHNALLKNITDDNVTVTIVTAGEDTINTVLAPGWNPELVKGVKDAAANTLQYGY